MEVEPTKAEEEQEEVRDEEAEEAAAEGAERKSRGGDGDDFYLRYYVGHKGRFGHEFLEFEVLPTGELRYANNSNYKHEHIIRKKAFLTGSVLRELRRIVEESGVLGLDDARWPMPDAVGKQELEVAAAGQHVSFLTAKIGSLLDVQQSQDPDGLRVLYYTVQDIKCFVLSLIGLHFKIKPII